VHSPTTGSFFTDDHHVKLPVIGKIRMKNHLQPFIDLVASGNGKILSATISENCGHYFISFNCGVEQEGRIPAHPEIIVGSDWGVKTFQTLSTGETIEKPNIDRYRKRLKNCQRQAARKQRGSKRHKRAIHRQRQLERKITNIRKDTIHKSTHYLTNAYGTVVIEDLRTKNLSKSGKHKNGLNRAILDNAPGEFRRQIQYKGIWNGSRIVLVPSNFPSTKMCSGCGNTKDKMPLSQRTYNCEKCGLVLDRDLNAARNLENYGRYQQYPREWGN
jgi:putative transposase